MRRVAASLLVLMMGCRFDLPEVLEVPSDAQSGSERETCTAWETRGGHVKDLCAMEPAGSWRIDSATATYDTDSGTYSQGFSPRSFLITQQGNHMLRVVSVDNFEVSQNAVLRVVGQYPLLVVSWSTIVVAGTIDVSSRIGVARPGAGGSRQDCSVAQNGQGASEAGGGGGAGLSQGGRSGGNGNTGATPNAGGMFGGSLARPVHLVIGGCRGGNGGGAGGQGGDGGGAIQLTARTSITITATGKVLAGGMGGRGAQGNGGGGGGGSGGYIGLDAPLVTTIAGSILAANGGAGGAGCEIGPGPAGQDGQDMSLIATGALGTGCMMNGANGGNGGARGAAPVAGVDSAFSGGGGGGGAGYIIVWAPSSGYSTNAPGMRTPVENQVTAIE